MRKRPTVLLFIMLWIGLSGSWALAHKVKCFAACEGGVISGYAWLNGGARPQEVPYRVFNEGGALVTEGYTDEEGHFQFNAQTGTAHRIEVDAGAGHTAVFTVTARELIESSGGVDAVSSNELFAAEPAVGKQEADLSIENALLRNELKAYYEQTRVRDVIAGLGYIAGLTGFAYYVMARRRFHKDGEDS